jgi:hypothetical protein
MHKKRPLKGTFLDWLEILASQGVEEEIREETIELDHDSGGHREPDGRKDRSGGEELFHGAVLISEVKR